MQVHYLIPMKLIPEQAFKRKTRLNEKGFYRRRLLDSQTLCLLLRAWAELSLVFWNVFWCPNVLWFSIQPVKRFRSWNLWEGG
jgi:hypothetical protein